MQIRRLTPDLSVSEQILPTDVPALQQAGFRSIVCHRPDGEGGAEQPSFAQIAAAAEQAGLQARHQPVVSGKVSGADGDAFAQLLGELPGPVFAYCRTGTRSTMLWALANAAAQPAEQLLATARTAGYDLAALEPLLRARHAG